MGGALHIVFNSMAETAANNVHQVAIDATAGVIRSYINDLAPAEKNTIQLVNKRIKTDGIVITDTHILPSCNSTSRHTTNSCPQGGGRPGNLTMHGATVLLLREESSSRVG